MYILKLLFFRKKLVSWHTPRSLLGYLPAVCKYSNCSAACVETHCVKLRPELRARADIGTRGTSKLVLTPPRGLLAPRLLSVQLSP